MAKGSSSLRKNKARSSKPYDASNSFVRKVTAQVSNLLPQAEWLTRWFSTSANEPSDDEEEVVVEDTPQPPSSKRAKISLNRTFPANSFRVAAEAELRDRRPQFSSPSPVRHAFPDAVAGPSGLSTSARFSTPTVLQSTLVSETLENKLNDGGSDSSESTSGCSSLVPQASKQNQTETLAARRRNIDDKLSLTNHLQSPRSLFPNRVRSPRVVPPPSRRRPSFNSSVFASPLQESDKLPSKELSPFYSGRTFYGGASAYRRPRENLVLNELNVSKRGIQVRPVNDSKDSAEASMSHTARRILETLEHFSSPVQDAKRMPLTSPVYRPPLGTKRKREEEAEGRPPPPPPLPPFSPRLGPPTQSLTVPTVADLIKLRSKEKLQDSMESARRIASSSIEPYSIRHSEERKASRPPGKVKKSSHIENESTEVNLPEVALPITTMPKFDIMVPVVSTIASAVKSSSFKFSAPISVTSVTPTVASQGTFTFSAPLTVGHGETVVTQNFLPSCPSSSNRVDNLKRKPKMVGKDQSDSVGFGIQPASELKTGSVMDFLSQLSKDSVKDKTDASAKVGFGDAFKPASGTWECDACMIRNKADVSVCVACETPQQTKAATLVKPSGGWACSKCYVSNKDSSLACVCCENPKSGTVSPKEPAAESSGSSSSTSWNCAACGGKNPSSAKTCSECWCTKPNSSSEPSKSLSESAVEKVTTWTCPLCKACNEELNINCKSCKKTKDASKNSLSKIKFNFEIPPEASTFKFGVDKSETAPSTSDKLGGFKFGETVAAPSASFTFGIPSSAAAAVQGSDKQKDVTVTRASSTHQSPFAEGSQKGNSPKVGGFSFGVNQNSEVSNSSSMLAKKGSNSTDSSLKEPVSGTSLLQKRKADGSESVVNEVKSTHKRKAESVEPVANEVKPMQNENRSPSLSKQAASNTSTSKPAISGIFSTTVSSSSLGVGSAGNSKTTNGGFSFVSSSTSSNKTVTTAPCFVFGSASSKTEDSSTKKPASLFSAPSSSTTGVPSFGSSITSSVNAVSSCNATGSSTATFVSPKPLFGTAASSTTKPSSPTARVSFTPPVTTTPSFGVPDTTTPAFGTSVTKPGSTAPTTTSATPTFGGSTGNSALPLFGVTSGVTVPTFGVTTAMTSPTFGSTSLGKPSFGTTATTSLSGTPVTTPSPFGSTAVTTASGSSSTVSPIFGSTSSTFPAAPTTAASEFGSTPTTKPTVFGSTSAAVVPAFGNTSVTSTPTFGGTSVPSFAVTAPSTIPNFGTASTTAAPTFGSSTPTFGLSSKTGSFGSPATVPNFGISATKAPTFGTTSATHSFGAVTATPTFGSSSTTPAFGTAVTSSAGGFVTPTATPSFGTPAQGFGTPKTESNFTTPTTSASIFGTPTTTSSFSSGFGNVSSPAFGSFSSGPAKGSDIGTFVFKGNVGPSVFGSSSAITNNTEGQTSKIQNFGFGTGTAGPFTFSAGSNTAPSVFGGNSSGTNVPSGTLFGSGATPAFGASAGSSGFASGGFNFSAGSNAGSQPFTFGSNQSDQNVSATFGQSQPTPPTFNPNVPPTFDFTGGETPQFTAQSSPSVAARRIKKAVRRTVR